MPHVDWVRGPLPQGLRRLGAGLWDGGPAPVPPAVGAEAHAAAGTCAAFRLHYLPAPVEVGYESYGPAAGAADPLGSRVGIRALALECMSVSRVAAALGISWHTANNVILTQAEQTITGNPHCFEA